MLFSDPAAALAAGVTVVTPNNRVARTLVARHDASMLRAGKHTWPGVRALPWSVWLATLWREAAEAGAAPADLRLMSPAEALFLWERIVRDDAGMRDSLLDSVGAARLAEQAWTLLHAYGSGGESWRAWRDGADDAGTFARWAERYQREVAARSAVDLAQLPERLQRLSRDVPGWRGRAVALAGFLELSPQQERLHAALGAAGMALAPLPPCNERSDVARATLATPLLELRAAMSWARAQVAASPDCNVCVAVEDLAARLSEVRAIAEEVLCPRLALPGGATHPRPYRIALGTSLAEEPLVVAALRFITLAHGPLPRTEAAALMRSPFWPGGWVARAGVEKAWIESGRTHLTFSEFAAALDHSTAVRLRAAASDPARRAQSPAAWCAQWRALLAGCGWPAGADTKPQGYEARQAWERLLDAFAQLGHVQSQLAPGEAPAILRGMAGRTNFEPAPPPAAIAIMDLRDASALAFDALWVVGLSAQRWPRPPQPNPLLPVAWQRERGVPRSSPERELADARIVTARLARCAPHVVMSSPAAVEDYASAPSALLDERWPMREAMPEVEVGASHLLGSCDLEAVRDERAPAFTSVRAPGGASTLAAQSTCPFQAMARRRLLAERWPDAYEALSYAERGQLVHAAMAAFWDDVRTHAALLALDPVSLSDRIARATAAARESLRPAERWRMLPPVVAAAEEARIGAIVRQWIERFERDRPDFAVTSVEAKAAVELAGLAFGLRIDRVDTFADGTCAIIDYKTGPADAPAAWFAERPRSPQLGLYALALRSQDPPAQVSAVAYAQLKAGAIKVAGIAADPARWPALGDADRLHGPRGWPAIVAWWERRLPELAAEFRDGVATVTPRDPPACCSKCGLQPLCRIDEAGSGEDAA